MSIDSVLKKEGIDIVKKLNAKEVNIVAKDIAIKLCLAFPEHNLNRSDLFDLFSLLDMYMANLPKDSSYAKFLVDNNAIFFNSNLTFNEIPDVAMHECIHVLQKHFEQTSNNFGLQNNSFGYTLNEASVQLMASEANMSDISEETYFDIHLKTISPDYYPLECAIVNQMAYFTGSFPLYHSTLTGNDIFKNTFITKFNKKIYNHIVKSLDKLAFLENEVNFYTNELKQSEKISRIKSLNHSIDTYKKEISNLFFDLQNYIIKNCFNIEFNTLKTNDDLYDFKHKLYNFKDVIGYNDNYTFYNDFYRDMMSASEIKKEQIKNFGEISLFESECMSLTIVDNTKGALRFVKTFAQKIKKLFGLRSQTIIYMKKDI